MKNTVISLVLMSLFGGCTKTFPAIEGMHNSVEKSPDSLIIHPNDRMPICDPYPYIYGSDEQGMWRSNGCSREYISK